MSLRPTLTLAALTAIYLCFELAFNARLLDLVGSAATAAELHDIERWGRGLSGVATALFALQIGLILRRSRTRWYTRSVSLGLFCAATGAATYVGLAQLTDYWVDNSSPTFRRASVSMVLLQRAVRDSGWKIERLNDDPTLFQRPEGKAALALLPFMGTTLARLDDIIADARVQLVRDQISAELGGPSGYFDRYADAVAAAAQQYQRYQGKGRQAEAGGDLQSQQDKAWNDYLRDLGRHGWSPYAVPEGQRALVLRKVRARVPVPADWDLADEQTFRAAVASKVAQRSAAANGVALPAGLSWPEFFAQPTVQRRLRERLGLPAGTTLKPAYDGPGFVRAVYTPMLNQQVAPRVKAYSASEAEFADGAARAELGRQMARSTIVPPLALFCSLLGALAHLCKLTYLTSKSLLQLAGETRVRAAIAATALVGLGALLLLEWRENQVTRSEVYQALMRDRLRDGGIWPYLSAHGLHAVIVGQQLSYPFNEAIRVQVLQGLSFGFNPGAQRPALTERTAP